MLKLKLDTQRIVNLFGPKPYGEVLLSNFHKLPDRIEVSWFRDGKYIIGKIIIDSHIYTTQAKSADEFLNMVNDTIYSIFEVPYNCLGVLSKSKRFIPSPEELEKLNNNSVKKSMISLIKSKEKDLVTA